MKKTIMQKSMVAALLSSLAIAVSATPAFVGDVNFSNAAENWASPSVSSLTEAYAQQVVARQAAQYQRYSDRAYPALAANGAGKTRAQVKQELADAAARGELVGRNNNYYPARSAYDYSARSVYATAQNTSSKPAAMVVSGN